MVIDVGLKIMDFQRRKVTIIGINPGLILFKLCQKFGIEEITYYGFTTDNTKRPSIQKKAFTKACIDAVKLLSHEDAELDRKSVV